MKTLMQKLQRIQSTLSAPKNQYNTFGKYHYRSLEDITEAVKPLLAEAGLALVIYDEIVLVGDRTYVKATATIMGDVETEKELSTISVSAYAREPLVRKGMDESQITGAASSYARKYAMNGLLAIDDTKDADSGNNRADKPSAAAKKATKKPDASPEPKINEIVEQAFFEFETLRKDALPKGFHYSRRIFYQVVEQKCGKLPGPDANKADSVAYILKQITPKEILEQDKE